MPRNGKTIDAPLVYLRSSETPLAGYVYHRPFPSTNAIDILKRYKIWNKVPKSVRAHLKRVHNNTQYDAYQPPPIHSEFYYPHIYQFRVIGPEQMLKAAKKCAEEQGIHSHIISTSLNDVEVQPIAETFANIACEIDRRGEPFKPPCILIIGGELTVSTEKTTGIGGRNQEFVLATVPYISGSSNIIVAAIDADGADGPTNIAGGIVDGYSMFRAEQHGINIFNDLQNHNCSRPLTKLGDTVFTGVLGQNLRSLIIIYVRSKQ